MLADLFLSVADAVISYTIDKLDPAETLKTWLKRDPAKLAFQKSLARTYAAFARQYPEYVASLFDQSFLNKEAIPEISKLLIRSQHPDPALLAQVWGTSIGFDPHSEFCKRATKPASDFLSWLEAELKAEQAFQALFDSRALDSLPRLEAEIERLTKELTRGLAAALKVASEYEKISINIGGDVMDSNIIIGDNNVINKYYYSGDFVSLNEYYIPPDGVFQRVRVDEFVGRDWLTAKVDAFLNDPSRKSGAFLLIGEAGVGKTSFMAHLVKERRYLHLFAEQAPGQAMVTRALQSLESQLITRYQIDPYHDRDTLNALADSPDFLEKILRYAVEKLTVGEKIIIVCDALDEAGVGKNEFVFGMPKELPDGVYLILSQRPVNTKLPNFEPLRFDLEAQGEDNLKDMEDYLSTVAKRPAIAGQIRAKDYSEDFFIQTLKEKSLGVWMYLHYIVKEIERGLRAPLDLESLPIGLVGYYADYWDNWRSGRKGSAATKWDVLYTPLLATLAAAQEAITVEKLIEWADVQASPSEVTRLLSESWGSFITEKEEKNKTVYTLYHQSLRDFITGKVEDIKKLPPTHASLVNDLSKKKVEAHRRIVNAFETECKGEQKIFSKSQGVNYLSILLDWIARFNFFSPDLSITKNHTVIFWEKLVEQDYPRLHLTAHMAGAEEYKKLTDLLTEGDGKIKWAEAREKKEETYAGYLNDLTYVWDYAEREKNYALAIRCMLIESSIHTLASKIPPELLAELAKAGLWSYARCFSTIREKSSSIEQEESLKLIIPNLPALLFQDALSIAREIKDEYTRANALSDLAPHLSEELKSQALAAAREIKDESARANALFDLAPHLSEELKSQALQEVLVVVREIKDEYTRASVLTDLASHLSEELKQPVLQEALTAAREIKYGPDIASALSHLAPHLSGELQQQVLQEALTAAREIKYRLDVSALSDLAPHLNEELKQRILQETLAATREIKDEVFRAIILADLTPYLNQELQAEALAIAREIESEYTRASALSGLAPYLNQGLQAEALAITREIEGDSDRARALAGLAPHLSVELKQPVLLEALAAAHEIQVESHRASALAGLAPHLSEELKQQTLQEALTAARKITDDSDRADALSGLALQLSEELKQQILQETLAATREINDESDRISTFTALTSYLNRNISSGIEALAAIRQIEVEGERVLVLEALAPYVSEELGTKMLDAIYEIKGVCNRCKAWALLAPRIDPELLTQIIREELSAALKIQHPFERAFALIMLAPILNQELGGLVLQDALAAVRNISDEGWRAGALNLLSQHLNPELGTQVLEEALVVAREIQGESTRAFALTCLAPHIEAEQRTQVLEEALGAAREIKGESTRARILSDLAPHLSEELKQQVLQEALVTARQIKEEFDRSIALSHLAPYLNQGLQAEVLAAAREIGEELSRIEVLVALAPHLHPVLQTEMLAAIREFKIFGPAKVFVALAPYLDQRLQAEALITAREINDESDRAAALAALSHFLKKEPMIAILQEAIIVAPLYIEVILKEWAKITFEGLDENIFRFIKLMSLSQREEGVRVVQWLPPALIHFSGPEIIPELYRSIKDTARWWP